MEEKGFRRGSEGLCKHRVCDLGVFILLLGFTLVLSNKEEIISVLTHGNIKA